MVDLRFLGFHRLNVFLQLFVFALLLDAFVVLAVHGPRDQLVADEDVGVDSATAAKASALALLWSLRGAAAGVVVGDQAAEGSANVDPRQVLKTPYC